MPSSVYRPRRLQDSQYYQCVEDHFEVFEQVYEERFEKQYGFFRPYVKQVIYRYLDCGILHNGFARVRCGDCGHEYLWPSRANAVTSVHLATKRGWWNSGSSFWVKEKSKAKRRVIP